MSFYRKEEPAKTTKTDTIADVYYNETSKKYQIRLMETLPMKDQKGRYIPTGNIVNPDRQPNLKKYGTENEAIDAVHSYVKTNPHIKPTHRLFPIFDI